MSEVGAPRHDPIPIGEVAKPPFARLPDPRDAVRAARRALRGARATATSSRPICAFLAGLAERPGPRSRTACPSRTCPTRRGDRAGARSSACRRSTAAASRADRGASRRRSTRLLALRRRHRHAGSGARARWRGSTAADDAARDAMVRAVLDDADPGRGAGRARLRRRGAAGAFRPARGARSMPARWCRSATASARPAAARRSASMVVGWQRRARRALLRLRALRHAVELRPRSSARSAARPRASPIRRSRAAPARSRPRPATTAAAT